MKKIIFTTKAPAPIGPYSQAVLGNQTLYISGQIPMKPSNNELITNDITKETEQVMENIKAILDEAGARFDQIVKTTIFLNSMALFDRVNTIYTRYFDEDTAPARETVEVARLPKDVRIEISAIAVL